MYYYVYLIASINNKKIISYVGYTKNLKKRLSLHNSSKGAKFTKGRKWILIYCKRFLEKKIAMSEEFKLKKNYRLRNKLKDKYFNKV
jgi:putative endonuclease